MWLNFIRLILTQDSSRIVMYLRKKLGEIILKKIMIIMCIYFICFPFTCFETSEEIQENSEENVIVNSSDGYTNDLIYNENYDYSLSYDE